MTKIKLPRIGMRIIKTAVAIFICLIVFMIRGEETSAAHAVIAAIICMQPYVENSLEIAKSRTIGTFIGGMFGVVTLIILQQTNLFQYQVFYYLVISVLVIPVILTTVAIKQPLSTVVACTVFLIITISSSDVHPVAYSVNRIIDTLVGIFAALVVNSFHFPRVKNKNLLFVSDLQGTLFDDSGYVSPTSIIKINQLTHRGAKITYATDRTPGMFLSYMEEINFEIPVICMRGAAVYDVKKREYIKTFNIERSAVNDLLSFSKEIGVHCFIYAVNSGMIYIFHSEISNTAQKKFYNRRRVMPENNFVYGDLPDEFEVVMLTYIDSEENIKKIKDEIKNTKIKESVNLFSSDNKFYAGFESLDIYQADVSKGSALKFLKELLSVETVIAFGNETDDESLLKAADMSYAVANANKALKYFATKEIGDNNSNSVAREMGRIYYRNLPKKIEESNDL